MIILVSPSVKQLRAFNSDLFHRLLGGRFFLGTYGFGPSGAKDYDDNGGSGETERSK